MMSHSPYSVYEHHILTLPPTMYIHASQSFQHEGKMPLNGMLVKIPTQEYYMIYINAKWKHTLTIIAGVSDVPVEIAGGVRIDWHGMHHHIKIKNKNMTLINLENCA